jgi:hypothetical protein
MSNPVNPVNAMAGCQLVGEYVDEGEIPTDATPHGGEVVRTHIVANTLDVWGQDDGLREFTVLLNDGRVIAVRGHSLKHSPHPIAGQDVYSIVIRSSGAEVLVALFKSADVAGIFHGDMRSDRKTA